MLAVGAEMLVRGASRLAAALGVTPLMVGLTVVAVGTSMPELAVGVIASQQDNGGLAVGNIAGTNVCNILLILGLSALLRPLPLHLRVLRIDLPTMVVACAAMAVLALDGVLSRLDGTLLLAAGVAYTAAVVRVARRETRAVKAEFRDMYGDDAGKGRVAAPAWARYATVLVAGIALTIVGAEWLVDGAVALARRFGVSDALIGLTVVALGTSAPELATTCVATLRDERDVAVGNLLGSSIYNVLAILAVTCLASPQGLPVERELLLFDIPLMTGVAILCVPVFVTGRRVSRAEGGLFVAVYLIYLSFLLAFRV